MSVKRSVVTAIAMIMVLSAGVALAQITEYEIKQGTVVSVWGNHLVVKMADGSVKDVEVPDGFEFDVNGRMLAVSALEPGMKLTAAIKTTSTPVDVYTTEVKHGEVLATSGRTVIVRTAEGTKKHTVDGDFPFWVDGEKKTVYDLRKGMKVTATIVSTETKMVTERDVAVFASGGAPAARAEPAAKSAPARKAASAAPAALPKTGSLLPLVGFAGIALLVIGIGVAVIRRF